MTYARPKLANHTVRLAVVADSNVKRGFCRDLAGSDDWPPPSVLCNLATVSIWF